MLGRSATRWPIATALGVAVLAAAPPLGALPDQAAATSKDECVSIGTPKPSLAYTYRQVESTGNSSEFTDHWEEFTKTGSRLRTTKGSRVRTAIVTVTRHRVENDVLVLDSTTQRGNEGTNSSTLYRPGAVAGPVYRACARRTWAIPAVTATNESASGRFSANTDPGTLAINAIRESVTVPAGRFETVHHTRTMRSATGLAVDQYWTSIEHGVTVKRTHTMPGVGAVTATLQAIRPALPKS